jgi:hypothetical protein
VAALAAREADTCHPFREPVFLASGAAGDRNVLIAVPICLSQVPPFRPNIAQSRRGFVRAATPKKFSIFCHVRKTGLAAGTASSRDAFSVSQD